MNKNYIEVKPNIKFSPLKGAASEEYAIQNRNLEEIKQIQN
jgi:hypothetical protein